MPICVGFLCVTLRLCGSARKEIRLLRGVCRGLDFEVHGLGGDAEFFLGQLIGDDDLEDVVARCNFASQLHAAAADQAFGVFLSGNRERRRFAGVHLLAVAEEAGVDLELLLVGVFGLGGGGVSAVKFFPAPL